MAPRSHRMAQTLREAQSSRNNRPNKSSQQGEIWNTGPRAPPGCRASGKSGEASRLFPSGEQA